jgi:hypothetical protein
MTGAAFGLVPVDAAELALCCTELTRDEADAVISAMALVMESRSEPVAVDRRDWYDSRTLLASWVMELTSLLAWERKDEATEVALEMMEETSTGLEIGLEIVAS